MNTSILQKCLDELQKENPKLDYIRGMLETLIDISEKFVDEKPTISVVVDVPKEIKSHAFDKTKLTMMQIDHLSELMKENSLSLLLNETIEEAIKRITDLDAIPDNFQSIKNFFTQIKGGVKIVDSSTSQGEIIKSQ